MTRLSTPARIASALAGAVALALMSAPAPAATVAAHVPGPGEIVLPAGGGIAPEHEPQVELPYSAIANLDAADNQDAYEKQARALPSEHGNLPWVNVGPLGQDDPADYPTGGLRFARDAGMGAAVAVDPADPSGQSVYAGNMGGLWHSGDGGVHWAQLSDKHFTRGAVGAIAVNPVDPDTIYVGTGIGYLTTSGDAPGSGVYVSHDRGKTFSRPAQNIRGYAVNAIHVGEAGVLFGTTDGLYISTDQGDSLHRVTLPDNADHSGPATGAYANWISAIAVNPLDAQDVVVAVGLGVGKRPGPDGPLSPGNGLYHSTTGPAGPYTFMASTSQLKHQASSNDPVGRIMMSWVKDPSGDTSVLWVILSDAGLAYGQQPGGEDGDLVSSTTGQSLNATNTELNGLYRSDDGGANFTLKATPQSLQASVNDGLGIYPALGYGVGVQAYYNLWVQADPRAPDTVYFGLEEVYQSVTGTQSGPGLGQYEIIQRYWDVCGSTSYLENIFTGASCPDATPYYGGVSTHPDQHAGTVVETPDGLRMYTGNDGGFFREDSHAITGNRNGFDNDQWVEMNTLATVQPYKVNRKPDGEYVIALQDNGGGFFAPGQTAKLVSSGDGVNAVRTSDPDTWYLSAQGAIVYVTTDHGKHIRAIPADMTGATFLSPLVIDPTDDNHLLVAARDIHETTKGSNTMSTIDPLLYTVVQTDWVNVFDAGTSEVSGASFQSQAAALRDTAAYVSVCGLCRNALGDPTKVFGTVATNVKKGCDRTKDTSACWHLAAGKGLPHNSIWNIAIDPADPNTIYVVLNNNSLVGFDPKVGDQKVMVSHDAGETFSDLTGNLPRSQARDIVVRDGKLIVATDNGVFTAPITGKAWKRLGAQLPPVRVQDLDLDATGRYLTAALYGRGVWSFDFQAEAPSSAGPGPKGEPHKPVSQDRGDMPATGTDGALAVVAAAFLAMALTGRRLGRRRAAA
jgi:hypothetical protein